MMNYLQHILARSHTSATTNDVHRDVRILCSELTWLPNTEQDPEKRPFCKSFCHLHLSDSMAHQALPLLQTKFATAASEVQYETADPFSEPSEIYGQMSLLGMVRARAPGRLSFTNMHEDRALSGLAPNILPSTSLFGGRLQLVFAAQGNLMLVVGADHHLFDPEMQTFMFKTLLWAAKKQVRAVDTTRLSLGRALMSSSLNFTIAWSLCRL